MVRQALATFGQIDILVNNAGVTRRADIMELTEADWDRIHRVNAKGVFFCLQRVAREMIPPKDDLKPWRSLYVRFYQDTVDNIRHWLDAQDGRGCRSPRSA
jgi:NAD(P)-dependent dehydrogenase (short-subunit alcohol dehydrogenase family)